MKSALLSRKFHSRPAAIIMVAAAALYVLLSHDVVTPLPSGPLCGPGLPAPAAWPVHGWEAILSGVILNIGIMALIVIINRTYNVLRAISWLPVGLFAIMQAAVPAQILAPGPGVVTAAVTMLCIFLMFSTYADPTRVRTIFLVFFIPAAAMACEYAFALMIVLFWIIALQMRVLTPRGFSASVLGILSAWIILTGSGIVDPLALSLPDINPIFDTGNLRPELYVIVTGAVTAILLIGSIVANLLKTIAYNARARAYSGAMVIMSIAVTAAFFFDFNNCAAYLTLLDFLAANHIAHYLVNHRYERQYIGVIAIIGIYAALYLWRPAL